MAQAIAQAIAAAPLVGENAAAFDDFFRDAPPGLAVDAIRRDLAALAPHYDVDRWVLPLPHWAMRPYDDAGPRAWATLRDDLAGDATDRPLCLYLHVPFCSRKCHFCDCYSFRLTSHARQQMTTYVDRLINELDLWAGLGAVARRPVSTIHLGGGTPTYLDEANLGRLCRAIADRFHVRPDTEWALESTAESFTPPMAACLHEWGFRRLHLGVQSLEDEVRAAVGRRHTAEVAVERLRLARDLGWIVSVDLICGLPRQTPAGFVAGIERLAAAGANGVSLYELLVYPQNMRWAVAEGLYPRRHLANYLLLQTGAHRLTELGYRRNLFNHWADATDDNRYFTFPSRGEDCLAVGTIADGVFGDYHFRHPRYAPYLRAVGDGQPGLEGGLRRTPAESALHPLTTALLAGNVPDELWAGAPLSQAAGQRLRDRWAAAGLVAHQPGGLALSASGAWFVGNMVRELAGVAVGLGQR